MGSDGIPDAGGNDDGDAAPDMASEEPIEVWYCEECPCQPDCSRSAWDRAQTWAYSRAQCVQNVHSHLKMSGKHSLCDADAAIWSEAGNYKCYMESAADCANRLQLQTVAAQPPKRPRTDRGNSSHQRDPRRSTCASHERGRDGGGLNADAVATAAAAALSMMGVVPGAGAPGAPTAGDSARGRPSGPSSAPSRSPLAIALGASGALQLTDSRASSGTVNLRITELQRLSDSVQRAHGAAIQANRLCAMAARTFSDEATVLEEVRAFIDTLLPVDVSTALVAHR